MRQKKGQVTIFIIVAILIIGGIIAFFVLSDKLSPESSIPIEIQPINQFVEDCLKETSENALIRIGEQGGYFLIFDEPSIEGRIPYYLQGTKKSIPSEEEVGQNLAGFVREELSFCILNFKDFKEDFKISHELKNVSVSILENSVRFSLDYPITITKKDTETTYQLKDFSLDIHARLNKIHEISEEIVLEQEKHPESICLSCLYDLGFENNVNIDMLDYGNSTIFTIIDNKSQINDEAYEWNFAIV
jgi:hypothetical protein